MLLRRSEYQRKEVDHGKESQENRAYTPESNAGATA